MQVCLSKIGYPHNHKANYDGGESWNPVGATSEKEEGFTPVPGGDENGGFEMNG